MPSIPSITLQAFGGHRTLWLRAARGAFAALALLALLFPPQPARAEAEARALVARAIKAMGGEDWARARALYLEGRIVWHAADRPEPRAQADDYRMWRLFERERVAAHEAAGMVRIVARHQGRTLFEIGSDGETSWNQDGPIPPDVAAETWASNFGFGVLRHALGPGFTVHRLPDDWVEGRPVHMVRLIDPAGQETLFGLDRETARVALVGFATPRGWHTRTYGCWFELDAPRWVQPGCVTLRYNGVVQNIVHWERAVVDPPLDPSFFRLGAPLPPR